MNILKFIFLIVSGIFFIITLGAFSMFSGSRSELNSDWINRFNDTQSFNQYSNTQSIELKDVVIKGARIPSSKANNFTFSNVEFIDFGGKESYWENGEFIDSEFRDFSFYNAHLKNVTFKNSKFIDSHFSKAKLENVKFINCEITKSAFFNMYDSSVEFINTKIFDNEYKFSESQIHIRLIDSEFRNTDMMSLKEGSSLYIENSVIDKVSFQYSNLEYIKAKNSKILNSSASDSTIHEIEISNSELKFSFGRSKLEKINVTSSNLQKFGMVKITADSVNILDCSDISKTSFAKANIGSIYIKNCDFSEIYPAFLNADRLEINNSKILETAFIESKISNLVLKDITFTKEADFTGFKANNAKIDNITKGPNLKIIMDGANIEF